MTHNEHYVVTRTFRFWWWRWQCTCGEHGSKSFSIVAASQEGYAHEKSNRFLEYRQSAGL